MSPDSDHGTRIPTTTAGRLQDAIDTATSARDKFRTDRWGSTQSPATYRFSALVPAVGLSLARCESGLGCAVLCGEAFGQYVLRVLDAYSRVRYLDLVTKKIVATWAVRARRLLR